MCSYRLDGGGNFVAQQPIERLLSTHIEYHIRLCTCTLKEIVMKCSDAAHIVGEACVHA